MRYIFNFLLPLASFRASRSERTRAEAIFPTKMWTDDRGFPHKLGPMYNSPHCLANVLEYRQHSYQTRPNEKHIGAVQRNATYDAGLSHE